MSRETMVNTAELVKYITWLASEREEMLSPIRVVKFLYLADLYHARRNEGKTLTGWSWRFVHYGPFCNQALKAVEAAVQARMIAAIPYESSFDDEQHFLYKSEAEAEPSISGTLPFYVTGPLQGAVRKWAGDTFGLLDYVYFETEPMKDVRPGDLLDFSKAKEPEPFRDVHMRRLPEAKISQGKALIAKMRESQRECLIEEPAAIYDDVYTKAIEFLDGEDLDLQIEGEAKIERDADRVRMLIWADFRGKVGQGTDDHH
jgi:hypothetical protein